MDKNKPIQHRRKWRIRWVDAAGTRRSEVYASYDEAELALRRHLLARDEALATGTTAASPPPPRTFSELCDRWLIDRQDKRSIKGDEGIIERHLRPHFGKLKLVDINDTHVARYRRAVSPFLDDATTYKNLTLLSALLHHAHRLGWLDRIPHLKKPRPKPTVDFRYLKTDEEVTRFLDAARIEGDDVLALYATAVYTGLRVGELCGLRWADVDLDRRLITVQRSFDGPTKTGDIRHVPILDVLLPVLHGWRRLNDGELVFPNRAGRMMHHSAFVVDAVLKRVLDRAGFAKRERRVAVMAYSFERSQGLLVRDEQGRAVRRPGRLVEAVKVEHYITFHDLRHTFASHWVMRGGDLFKLQKILGHKSIDMTLRYAHLAPEAFAADWGRLGPRPGARVVADAAQEE